MAKDFDIVVIGGGHAGAEAAWAAARMGAATALVTLDPRQIAQMACNPAIGGVGKGQIVREIDAMGGLMGLAADATGIQFRMLNRSKGPAVWGPRCQSDRHDYAAWVRGRLERVANLEIITGEAVAIVTVGGRAAGVTVRDGGEEARLECRAVIVTAGTFLNGLMHLGDEMWPGGRYDEPAAASLSESLTALGISLARLKTGTCARLAGESIDYSLCERQDGDEHPAAFSFMNDSIEVEQGQGQGQKPCWITHTNEEIHRKIRDNLHRAPLYTGQITSTGPRYCPSIETKIGRFADKTSHQIFLEPEGRSENTNWVYCNGISTSLPRDVQEFMIRHIAGLADAEILRYGYAIEYDYAPPTQLKATLETRAAGGLFLAGQVNGTTGYEEAAAQGMMAAINAVASVRGEAPLVLGRDQAYIGVMIDDLVTKGIIEPYRMFTSRAEHRLRLRADNADRRLTEIGRRVGLVDEVRWRRFSAHKTAATRGEQLLRSTRLDDRTIWRLLQRPASELADLVARSDSDELIDLLARDAAALASVAVDARYSGYLEKEDKALARMQALDRKLIGESIDYAAVPHLRHEAREALLRLRPRSLGQALRITGITPADVTVLAVHVAARGGQGQATS